MIRFHDWFVLSYSSLISDLDLFSLDLVRTTSISIMRKEWEKVRTKNFFYTMVVRLENPQSRNDL